MSSTRAVTGAAGTQVNGGVDAHRVSEVLLSVVADKTGYPVDMLDVSMNLDADLGIDSIKRVEILAALQEALPEAPVVAPDQLGELRTLSQIVDVLAQGAPAGPTHASSAPAPDQPARTAPVGVAPVGVAPVGVAPVGVAPVGVAPVGVAPVGVAPVGVAPVGVAPVGVAPVGVAPVGVAPVGVAPVGVAPAGVERLVPTLRPLGSVGEPIGLPAGAKIWVTKSGDVLSGQIVDELSAQGYSAEEVELADRAQSPDDVAGLIVVVPPRVTDDDILFGFGRVRAMAPVLRRAALQGGALLCSVTCLGGGFALEAAPPEDVDPTGGAWGGLTKTAAAEWTEVDCKSIDVDPNRIDLASDVGQVRSLEGAGRDRPGEQWSGYGGSRTAAGRARDAGRPWDPTMSC